MADSLSPKDPRNRTNERKTPGIPLGYPVFLRLVYNDTLDHVINRMSHIPGDILSLIYMEISPCRYWHREAFCYCGKIVGNPFKKIGFGPEDILCFLDLSEDQRKRVWDYMNALPLYREAESGGKIFVLVHGGLGNFSPDKEQRDYKRDELTWCRPEPDTVYFPDKLVVVGHTPTQLFYDKAGCPTKAAKFYRTDSFIDIDCGCVFRDGRLGCLCLDTMEEIYA